MDVLGQFLDDREDPQKRHAAAVDAQKDRAWWEIKGATEEQRLLAFEAWCRRQIQSRLVLSEEATAKARRTGQCLAEIKCMLLELFRRGWLLDGARLAPHVIAVLDDVGNAQRAGRVQEFWPFFRSVVRSYVGRNAEEIRSESMRAGNIASMAFTDIARTLPALVAQEREELNETLREKKTRARAKQAEQDKQGQLF
ncbi:hypothetical protein [Actomonas aquatica]|uniref:Uncharacterized protein n=1 Tax=Actomonas aquatica TaxID=2866162 RepID=A0ABZ1CCH2_9BACT|nr:hypothetical protein [Opitutus sp. WL0086]WRQ89368.1 hypothetical protein K1X11_008100 [Opitutus sp. WL0086]